MLKASIGKPIHDMDLGSIARMNLGEEVDDQALKSLKKVETGLRGGQIPNRLSAYYTATTLPILY